MAVIEWDVTKLCTQDEEITQTERQKIIHTKSVIAIKGGYSNRAVKHLERLELLYEDYMREYTVGRADRELLDMFYQRIYKAIHRDVVKIARIFWTKYHNYLRLTLKELILEFHTAIYKAIHRGEFDSTEFYFGTSYRNYLNWIRKDMLKHRKRYKVQLNDSALSFHALEDYIACPVRFEKMLLMYELLDEIIHDRGLSVEEKQLFMYMLKSPNATRKEQAAFLGTTNNRKPERIMQRISGKVSDLRQDYKYMMQEEEEKKQQLTYWGTLTHA